MRDVVVESTVSLDGFVAPVPGGADHRPIGDDRVLKAEKLERLGHAGTHIMGRVTYQEMAAYWPTSDDSYAAPMNDLPKVVFSKTLQRAAWSQTRIERDLEEGIEALRREDGGDIIAWGGARFLQSLSSANLVDEYRITVNPIALGDGLPLFKNLTAPLELQLIQTEAAGSGAVFHVYRPRR